MMTMTGQPGRDDTLSTGRTGRTGEPPWLSILVPVYNVAPYLEDCIASITAQLAGNGTVEIRLIDDCSTDGSFALAEQLAAESSAPMTVTQHDRNRGPGAARNSLLEAARGNYVWFIDSDDYVLPGAIGGLRAIVDDHAPDTILFDYRKRRALVKKGFPGRGGQCVDDIAGLIAGVFSYGKMYPWLRVTRRDLWGEDLRFPEGVVFEDIANTPELLLRTSRYYYAPHPWLYYRIRGDSVMGSVTRTPGHFDVAKHDDMAMAMADFRTRLTERLGPIDDAVAFAVSHFVAKEFVKLAKRCRKASTAPGNRKLSWYHERFQSGAPLPFDRLAREYLKRIRLYEYWALRRTLRYAESEAAHAG